MKQSGKLIRSLMSLFREHRLSTAAAGLSYYLTMTFFPLLISLYSLLGHNYEFAAETLSFLEPFIPGKAYDYILSFMEYVTGNYSVVMLALALSVILFTSSAAFRSLAQTIGKMQGSPRYTGILSLLFSFLLSILFPLTVYMAVVVMFLGKNILEAVNELIPFVDLSGPLLNLRYLLLFVVSFLLLSLVYRVCRSRERPYRIFVGALVATALLVGVSAFFSVFINASVKYPLVYSSLGSLIILMFWLYACSEAIYLGAALNIALRDVKNQNG